ncbi:MAG: PHP domain-containing protein [Nevskiaceae bacterium]|nr:MAG: PHP domain-containing protein [Nevskiaceae bacterium]TBR72022.1 MAG: PHP domain-containing protein [Nevskiaceae bacterium]
MNATLDTGIDLHCHSTASDGTLSPAAVVAAAHAAGVRTLALTDHDTLAGLDAARTAAASLGLHFIDGVEISTRWRNRTIHVVALDFDPAHTMLHAGLAGLQAQRCIRAAAIATRLEALGLRDALPRAQALAAGGQITRAHFARLLVADRLCRNAQQAFKRFLGTGKPADVKCDWVPMAEAIGWVHIAGGQIVLAHPLHYDLSRTQLGNLLRDFQLAGGVAVETSTATTSTEDRARVAAMARAHGLCGSRGSDFHDPSQSWRRLGAAAPLPESLEPVWARFRVPPPVCPLQPPVAAFSPASPPS